MQVIYQNENERDGSRRTNPVDLLIYIGRISGCLKGEYTGELGSRTIGIQDSGGIFNEYQKRIWRRRRRIGEGGRVENIRVERENNGGICTRV